MRKSLLIFGKICLYVSGRNQERECQIETNIFKCIPVCETESIYSLKRSSDSLGETVLIWLTGDEEGQSSQKYKSQIFTCVFCPHEILRRVDLAS